jgi:hypothetical protein
MRAALLACAMAMSAAPAGAQDVLFDGREEYRVTLNGNGAVLRSRHLTIYLGRACDARSPQLGRGRWEWANGGILVRFRNRAIGFARQEIDADPDGRCRS